MTARYSDSTLRILQAAAGGLSSRPKESVELGLLKYLVDCVAAMKEVFSSTEAEDPLALQQLVAPFVHQIGCVLKECFVETSPVSRCSGISRQAASSHILAKFPDLRSQRVSEPTLDLPLIHFAVFNCQELALVRSLVSEDPNMLQLTDSGGALPLHWSAIAPPATLVRQKSEVHSFLLEQCPASVLQEDDEGLLALHWAVNQDSADLNLICQLVELAPDSVSRSSAKGLLPLHLAVNRSQPVLEVVLYLLECYPEGIQEPCRLGWLPLHYCVNRSDISLPVLKLLLDRYPEAVNYRSDLGQLPLHRLLDRASPAKRAAKYLIQTDPASLKTADNDGFLPLHTLLSSSEPPASSLVKLMVHSCFSSVRQRTGDGWLPIHLAMKLTEHLTPAAGSEDEDNHIKKFLDVEPHQPTQESKSVLPLQRVVAILQELLSVFPESLDEYVVELRPPFAGADWGATWKKVRWTPMSFALAQGKHSTLARALRPFRKKVPLTPAPPGDSSSNLILPSLSRSPPRHAASTGDLEGGEGRYQTPITLRSLQRPHTNSSGGDTPLIHFSSLASPQSPLSPNPSSQHLTGSARKNGDLSPNRQESFLSDLV